MFNKEINFRETDVDLNGKIFLAKVLNRMDPEGRERVFVRVLGVHDFDDDNKLNGIWAERIAPTKNVSGDIPDDGDWVYVIFPEGNKNPMRCLWLGWARYNE